MGPGRPSIDLVAVLVKLVGNWLYYGHVTLPIEIIRYNSIRSISDQSAPVGCPLVTYVLSDFDIRG